MVKSQSPSLGSHAAVRKMFIESLTRSLSFIHSFIRSIITHLPGSVLGSEAQSWEQGREPTAEGWSPLRPQPLSDVPSHFLSLGLSVSI